jgi:MFS family permease
VVFFLGFLGAIFSSYNLWFVAPQNSIEDKSNGPAPFVEGLATKENPVSTPLRKNSLRWLNWAHSIQVFRLDILKSKFRRILILLVVFHTAQFLAIPIFSLYMVDVLHFSDQVIGLGTAMFNVTVFLGSLQLVRIIGSLGNHKTTGLGVFLLGFYPFLLAFSHNLGFFILTSLIGGIAWALAGGALYNYLLEMIPERDRPAHMAWYNLGLNAAILIGSLGGTALAGAIGLTNALILYGIARAIAGLAILRWG